MRLILNEKQLLEKSLNKGYVDTKKPSNTIKILAKHFLSIGMDKEQTYESIDGFLIKYYDGYISANWYKLIKGIINRLVKNKDFSLVNIKSVKITECEINKIKLLDNFRLEKLAFALLVYAKIYNQLNHNNSNWVNEEHKYIFSDAKIAVTKKEQGKMIYKLKEFGYVDVPLIVNSTNIKVNFVNNDSDVVIKIVDFRNFVYEYLRYFNPKKYMNCVECGKLIKITNNKLKYCPECAKEIEKENSKLRFRKWYNKQKSNEIENR